MRRLTSFLSGMLTGGLLLYLTMNLHVIRARDGFHLIAKAHPQLAATYVDIRQFGVADWAEHPEVAAALVNSNRRDLMENAVDQTLGNGLDRLLGREPRQ
jgi:hypothetical protein